MSSLEDLHDLAERLAASAAARLLEGLQRPVAGIVSKSTDTDLSTEMDRSSEKLIVEGILTARPEDSILGEEGTDISGSSGVSWILDPLDGTTNYLYGHPGFSVSIAVLVDGEPSIGVVADPLAGDLFSARSGQGATRNGTPISCSDQHRLEHALVATGFAYARATRSLQAEVLREILPAVRDVRRMGGAAVDLCSAACGRVDAYYEWGLQPWDLAAGVIIAAESGARVGNLDGGPPGKDLVLASPPQLFDSLAELLSSAGARQVALPSPRCGPG